MDGQDGRDFAGWQLAKLTLTELVVVRWVGHPLRASLRSLASPYAPRRGRIRHANVGEGLYLMGVLVEPGWPGVL